MATPVTALEGVADAERGRRAGVVARCTAERLMKAFGLHGARRGRTMRTTRSDPAAPRPADLVDRNFNPSRPDAL
jgi:putative transposase